VGNCGEEWLSLHINLKGRDPFGTVDPGEYHQVRNELRDCLLKNSNPEVKAVHFSEDIFKVTDPRAERTPDLMVETSEGNVKSDFAMNQASDFEPSKFVNGCHRRRGMFVLYGKDVRNSHGEADLIDIPATVLAWQGVPVPKHFEGRLLHEFIEALVDDRQDTATGITEALPTYFSEEGESGVRKKLESLGYM